MFNWFFRQSTPVEKYTTYINSTTWIAELNSPNQLQTIKELFATTFDSDNFIVIDEGTSVTAILSGDEKYQCTLTFGYNNAKNRIAVISFLDDDDENTVKPTINAFGVELETHSLLFEQPIKEQKTIENFMVPMKQIIYEKDIIIDEENTNVTVMLRENVDVKKMLGKIAKFVKEKYLLEGKTENGKLVFVEKGNEKFKMVIQIGRNSEKQRLMAVSCNEVRQYWKELYEGIVGILMNGKCFASYASTAVLRKNLKKCTLQEQKNVEKVEKKDEKVENKEEVKIQIENDKNEVEKKEEKKDEVQIPIENEKK